MKNTRLPSLTAHHTPRSGHAFVPWTELVIQADRNGDGGLTLEEIERLQNHGNTIGAYPFMHEHFNGPERNGNERVNMHEIKAVIPKSGRTDAELFTGFTHGEFMWHTAPT